MFKATSKVASVVVQLVVVVAVVVVRHRLKTSAAVGAVLQLAANVWRGCGVKRPLLRTISMMIRRSRCWSRAAADLYVSWLQRYNFVRASC